MSDKTLITLAITAVTLGALIDAGWHTVAGVPLFIIGGMLSGRLLR